MIDWTALQATTSAIIAQYGMAATLRRRRSAGVFNSATGFYEDEVSVDMPVVVLDMGDTEFTSRGRVAITYGAGSHIMSGDVEPMVGDLMITADGRQREITTVKALSPAGTALLYTIELAG